MTRGLVSSEVCVNRVYAGAACACKAACGPAVRAPHNRVPCCVTPCPTAWPACLLSCPPFSHTPCAPPCTCLPLEPYLTSSSSGPKSSGPKSSGPKSLPSSASPASSMHPSTASGAAREAWSAARRRHLLAASRGLLLLPKEVRLGVPCIPYPPDLQDGSSGRGLRHVCTCLPAAAQPYRDPVSGPSASLAPACPSHCPGHQRRAWRQVACESATAEGSTYSGVRGAPWRGPVAAAQRDPHTRH